MKLDLIKYKCLFCLRHNFDKPMSHNCVGGYRKRKIEWEIYFAPENVVLFEKMSSNNVYKHIMSKILKTYSKKSKPYGRKNLQK